MAKPGAEGPLWFLRGSKITNHSDLENYLVANMLNGWESSEQGKKWLIELFRSNVVIDRQTRDAIANALERDEGLRLKLVRGDQRPTAGTAKLRLQHELQEIADDVTARIAAGEVPKNAKADVARERGIGLTKVKDALAYRKANPNSEISKRSEDEGA
jgi:hypothetical protein